MKRLLITLCLCIFLLASIITVIALYISGPNIKYETEIQRHIESIKEQSKEEFSSIERHVFRYITYVATTKDEHIWFNSENKELLRRKNDELTLDSALQKVRNDHSLSNLKVTLGYGYEQGVYVVENNEYLVLLDIDTLEEIYYQRK